MEPFVKALNYYSKARPDNIESPLDFIKYLWQFVEEIFSTSGSTNYKAFVLCNSSVGLFDLSPIAELGKNVIGEFLKKLTDSEDVIGIGFLSECWMIKYKYEGVDPARVARARTFADNQELWKHEDSIEMVLLNVEFRDGRNCSRTAIIDRSNESARVKLTKIEDQTFTDFSGRLVNYFKKRETKPDSAVAH